MAKTTRRKTTAKRRSGPKGVTPADIISSERKAEALALRKQGYDYATIGRTLEPPCTPQNAHKLVASALRELVPDQAAELREMMGARLDDLLIGVWDRALKGDTFAIGDAMKIMERQARLQGLDAPQKQEVDLSVNEAKSTLERKLSTMADRLRARAAAMAEKDEEGSG